MEKDNGKRLAPRLWRHIGLFLNLRVGMFLGAELLRSAIALSKAELNPDRF
jgi:hypothetical protein